MGGTPVPLLPSPGTDVVLKHHIKQQSRSDNRLQIF